MAEYCLLESWILAPFLRFRVTFAHELLMSYYLLLLKILCSSLLTKTSFIKSSRVLLLIMQKGNGLAHGIQRCSHRLIVFVLVSLHVKNLAYWGSYSLDTCLWYAQIDYLGRYDTNSKVDSLFVEMFCQNMVQTRWDDGYIFVFQGPICYLFALLVVALKMIR